NKALELAGVTPFAFGLAILVPQIAKDGQKLSWTQAIHVERVIGLQTQVYMGLCAWINDQANSLCFEGGLQPLHADGCLLASQVKAPSLPLAQLVFNFLASLFQIEIPDQP